jgi:hypothetical protein
MPARITVKAELQSLLNKSQALTDANRLAQLDAERRRREELAQLAAKRQKEQEEATRRKQIEDPVGRVRLTAAMGQRKKQGLGILWYSFARALAFDSSDNYSYALQFKVASGNGLVVETFDVTHTFTLTGDPIPATPEASGQQVEPLLYIQFFPAASGGVLVTLDVREGWAFDWPERTSGTTAITPGTLIDRWGANCTDAAAAEVTVSTANESSLFAQYEVDFYPTFDVGGDTTFALRVPEAQATVPNAASVPEIGSDIVNLWTPLTYAINETWAQLPSSYEAASLVYDALLVDAGLPSQFPDDQTFSLATSTAAPTEPPALASDAETAAAFSGSSVANSEETGWVPVLAASFGFDGYVATKYAELTAPPPPPP